MKTKKGKAAVSKKTGKLLKAKKGDTAVKKFKSKVKEKTVATKKKKRKVDSESGTTAVKKTRKHAEGLVAMSDSDRTWLEGHVKGYRYRKRDNMGIIQNRTGWYWIAINSGGGYSLVSITGFDKDETPIESHVFRQTADNAAKRINKILRKMGFSASV